MLFPRIRQPLLWASPGTPSSTHIILGLELGRWGGPAPSFPGLCPCHACTRAPCTPHLTRARAGDTGSDSGPRSLLLLVAPCHPHVLPGAPGAGFQSAAVKAGAARWAEENVGTDALTLSHSHTLTHSFTLVLSHRLTHVHVHTLSHTLTHTCSHTLIVTSTCLVCTNHTPLVTSQRMAETWLQAHGRCPSCQLVPSRHGYLRVTLETHSHLSWFSHSPSAGAVGAWTSQTCPPAGGPRLSPESALSGPVLQPSLTAPRIHEPSRGMVLRFQGCQFFPIATSPQLSTTSKPHLSHKDPDEASSQKSSWIPRKKVLLSSALPRSFPFPSPCHRGTFSQMRGM